jgi:hypothetical protein
MFLDLIKFHIPRSLKAAVALIVLFGSSSIALAGLTQVMVGAHAMDWIKVVFGSIVALPATIIFYMEQSKASQVKSKADVETEILSQAGEELRSEQKSAEIKAWNMEVHHDGPPKT